MPRKIFLLGLLAAMGGCSSLVSETHYFKSVDRRTNETINYYRLQVTGFSLFSSSRYLSGMFDQSAVNSYFNEFTQPSKGEFIQAASQPAGSDGGDAAKSSQQVTTLSGKPLDDRRLLLLFSTNSDEIASQISNIATSQDIANNLVKLASRDAIKAQAAANSELSTLRARNSALANLGDQLLTINATAGNDLSDMSQEQVEQNLLAYANALASELGNETAFKTLDEAADWLKSHRAALLKGNP